MELSEYGRAIARSWLIVLVCLLAGVGVAWGVTSTATPVYQSAVKFYVVSPPATGQSSLQSLELSRGRIASYASLVKSDKFVEKLVSSSSTGLSAADIAQSVSASADQDTMMLTVVVSMPDQAKALGIAREIVSGLNTALADVEAGRTQSGGGQTVLNVVAGPTDDTDPVSPRLSLNLGLGALLGLGAGIAIAVARRMADHTLRTPEDVEAASGLPLLARVPVSADARKFSGILDRRAASLLDEAARRLRTNVDHLPALPASGVVLISSARAGEGKTTVALMLARAWADAGEKVLLVETDLRRPRLASELKFGNTMGLTDVLAGRAGLNGVIQKTASDRLHIVAAGSVPENPTELLASRAMTAALGEMRGSYSRVILDAPAMQPFSDAALLAVQADFTVLVVRYRSVTRELLGASLRNLDLVKVTVAGAVLNALPLRLSEGRKQPRAWLRRPIRRAKVTPPAVPAEPAPVKHSAGRR
ncbi:MULTISPECIES: polysaccharide biosynthesis tyrosine autokinase [unclassified Arthrobacter]|uniref:polysaccharide biosynthesis tyrosine autokinase n=1 Tax=unclassified Arthrobacter TaxID=235627 RepID=UPI001E508BEC|nr:polysaccharide biosynthesis tyrosine autokinase [Arthrobacter sp. Bi26]